MDYWVFVCFILTLCENANEQITIPCLGHILLMINVLHSKDQLRFAIETDFAASMCLGSSWSTHCVKDLRAGRSWPLSARTARVIKNQLRLGLGLEVG